MADRAQEASRLRQEVKYYREREARDFGLEGLIGGCPTMQRIFAQVFGATVNASGVIQKETGGKRIAIRG